MQLIGLIASNGNNMMNKRLSPLDGLFDQKSPAPAAAMSSMQQYEEMPEPTAGAMSALNKMQQGDQAQQTQQPQQDPYAELNQMLESPEGDMMQDYMEDQRQQKAKNRFLFR